jgi:pyruvate,water dikinase
LVRRLARLAIAEARARVRDRENLRFERTRVFGRVRRLVVAMGRHLAAGGLLAEPDDVFHLTVEELLGVIEGTHPATGLPAVAAARRQAFAALDDRPAPPARFETVGAVGLARVVPAGPGEAEADGRAGEGAPSDTDGDASHRRRGVGCCPGRVTGTARIIRDPVSARLAPGEILVAAHTDPGWITLFARAGALVVERGSLLSHSAIVSREMGIPAVVAVPGVMDWIADGETVVVDGGAGTVERLAGAAPP